MVQFTADKERDTRQFFFEGLKPRADSNDTLGEGWGGRRVQESYDRGFFDCWEDKVGTVRDDSNKPGAAAFLLFAIRSQVSTTDDTNMCA